jgi:hypothetical protein
MNPLAIESALKAALSTSAFPTTAISTGTSFTELSPETLNLIVSADTLNSVGVGAYTATITVKLHSPALLGADSYASFSAAQETLKTALTQAYLFANWPANDAPNIAGASPIQSISTSQDGNSWTADIQLTLGVVD